MKEYYTALNLMGVDGPRWEELSDEQRENIRQENNRYQQEMQAFGRSLSKGEL
jgi:TRAP-type C4-dicarboxylate transport system substrate-binding protein